MSKKCARSPSVYSKEPATKKINLSNSYVEDCEIIDYISSKSSNNNSNSLADKTILIEDEDEDVQILNSNTPNTFHNPVSSNHDYPITGDLNLILELNFPYYNIIIMSWG